MEIYNDRKNGGQRKTPRKDNDADEENDTMEVDEDEIWILLSLCVYICIA